MALPTPTLGMRTADSRGTNAALGTGEDRDPALLVKTAPPTHQHLRRSALFTRTAAIRWCLRSTPEVAGRPSRLLKRLR